jgi:riboflavin synthase
MFTGIVQAVGQVISCRPLADGLRIDVDAGTLDRSDVVVGDSIAVNGCCLTVVAIAGASFGFDASRETLMCTAGFDAARFVNLEKALRLSDRLGGHLMSGHVDGVGTVTAFAAVTGDRTGSWRLEVESPPALARYIAGKGSIAVDGVSLTTNTVATERFTVNLIAHTLAVTTLGKLASGARVNLEVDLIARYLDRLRAGSD